MRHRSEAPVVVLSPHLDDAVLSAWSVLRRAGPVVVVNACDAVPPAGILGPYDRAKGAADSAEFARLRLAEDREALALAGREPVGLGFLDAQYRDAVRAAHLNAPPLDPGGIGAALAAAVRRRSRPGSRSRSMRTSRTPSASAGPPGSRGARRGRTSSQRRAGTSTSPPASSSLRGWSG
jgi:hypothetical protein